MEKPNQRKRNERAHSRRTDGKTRDQVVAPVLPEEVDQKAHQERWRSKGENDLLSCPPSRRSSGQAIWVHQCLAESAVSSRPSVSETRRFGLHWSREVINGDDCSGLAIQAVDTALNPYPQFDPRDVFHSPRFRHPELHGPDCFNCPRGQTACARTDM